ncbi:MULTISPECIES: class I SAM-dependent DNA methyltransferase [unclassified Clostridium]|uniref:class I SAM-dependent DNA methyltransferase n=1 Tax=unclassified Clostridium TaxID=2614128 RepID=UPI0025C55D87|nr:MULTISPECIES: class I SAM-dependent methyltransferase [unclassified Clostridium]
MYCYKNFASIYDELIYGDVDYKNWGEKILKICEEYSLERRNYLDLACGTGNLTVELGKSFQNVYAVDLSQEMLTVAEEKLRGNGIRAKVFCQNICNLNIKNNFDLITCALDSTNYITEKQDLKKYFEGVYNLLREDGLFIFDVNSRHKLINILGNNIFNYDSEDVVYIWENYLEDDIVNMYLTFFVREGQVYKRFDEEHCERAYSEEDIEDIFKKLGFKLEKKLDCYDNIPVSEKTERITYVLRK